MNNSIFSKLLYEFEGFKFFIRNIKGARPLSAMQDTSYQNYQLTGLTRDCVEEVDKLHKSVRNGRGLNFWRKLFMRLSGSKVCSVAINKRGQLVGFNYYYFRENEVNKGIIHDAYLGISPNERGKGIGTALQAYSVDQFKTQPLSGISGNVSKVNTPSVKMLERVGFMVFDDPDDDTNCKIFYNLNEN